MPAKKRILTVSHDEGLHVTRRLILASAGFDVSSSLGPDKALELCDGAKFDLIVVGHSLPRADKLRVVEGIKKSNCGPILSLRRQGDLPVPGADYSVEAAEGPEWMLRTVCHILGVSGPIASS
ncbi:MAG: hypothetical protein JWO13_2533 [Acidobacteriales bacterium]|nr:hypothetical protein [Terriglobales bacterium]